MGKFQKNQNGFTALEGLLAFVIIGIVGFTGWYVYHAQQNANKNLATTSSSTPTFKNNSKKTNPSATTTTSKSTDPYVGWKTYNATNEGLSFKYPSNWTAKDDPCVNPDTQVAGQCYQILTPQTAASPYIFVITYYWNQQKSSALNGGETIKSITPLNVSNSKTPLSLIAFSVNQTSSENVSSLYLTDQTYSVGQTVSNIPNVISQKKSGMTYTFSAGMQTPSAQYDPGYTLAQYRAHPDYNDVVKLFQSISY